MLPLQLLFPCNQEAARQGTSHLDTLTSVKAQRGLSWAPGNIIHSLTKQLVQVIAHGRASTRLGPFLDVY